MGTLKEVSVATNVASLVEVEGAIPVAETMFSPTSSLRNIFSVVPFPAGIPASVTIISLAKAITPVTLSSGGDALPMATTAEQVGTLDTKERVEVKRIEGWLGLLGVSIDALSPTSPGLLAIPDVQPIEGAVLQPEAATQVMFTQLGEPLPDVPRLERQQQND